MRYFTRSLYQQFNSPDDEVADRADEVWEAALVDYGKHLDGIPARMPATVSKLADLNLHDAEILSRVEEIQPGAPVFYADFPFPGPFALWSAVGIVTVRMGNQFLSLIYCLWDHIRVDPAPEDWQFSKLREHWLYDEVDIVSEKPGPFVHRILLSSGVQLEVPFSTVVIHSFPAHPEPANAGKKQSA